MEIAVFGAGYVGCVTATCLASFGHRVYLVDVAPQKIELLRAGKSPVVEPGLHDELTAVLRSGQIVPLESANEAINRSELALICVGTPSQYDGSPSIKQVHSVLLEIANAVADRPNPYVIALRSTLPYPYVSEELIPLLADRLGDRFGKDIGFALNPEFLREGQAIEDFKRPPFMVVGTEHELAAEKLKDLYRSITAPFFVVSPGTASLLKYACNAFHAVKVAFANEIASLEAAFGADANVVMDLFCLDRSLNLSQAYLRPGFAFGGSCLPKDLRALNRIGSLAGILCPLLESVLRSNEIIMQRAVEAVHCLKLRDVVIIGLSFKAKTDDLRESPLVKLAEQLLGQGYRLRIYDPDVQLALLHGRNLQYVEQHLAHLTSLLSRTPEDALQGAQLIVIGKMLLSKEQLIALCPHGVWVLDLIHELPRILPPLRILRISSREVREGCIDVSQLFSVS